MSESREAVREIIRASKRNRIINTVLWVFIFLLLGAGVYVTTIAVKERKVSETLRIKSDSLLVVSEQRAESLRISEENLQFEKEKLEQVQVSYDSLRQVLLEEQNQDELWDLTVAQNTVQAYGDYIKVKGINDNVIEKLEILLTRTGYIQIQESNGTMLFQRFLGQDMGLNLWTPTSTRSVRNGVIGKSSNSGRNGDAIFAGQPIRIIEDSIYTGNARWAKIKY